jgi:hypothetical protein
LINNSDDNNTNDATITEYQQFAFSNSILKSENDEKVKIYTENSDNFKKYCSFYFHFKPRIIKLKRDPACGLGLCVKGGKEHNLPLLISNMFKGQPGKPKRILIYALFIF